MHIKTIEFYSGIGGMHYGLKEAAPNAEILAAFDINTSANEIYCYNFPNTNLRQNNIEGISVQFLEELDADLWTMSPPCQPFTKKGLQLGEEDRRTDSFTALMDKFEEMTNPPRLILLENVVGFEKSTICENLMARLARKGFSYQEFILSPMQYGVPNSRPRYYLLASQSSSFSTSSLSREPPGSSQIDISMISDFLELEKATNFDLLDRETIQKYAKAIDIVTKTSKRSACFTKSYGTYLSGCGSYFCPKEELVNGQHLAEEAIENLENIEVRKLTPREVANLMCFPSRFQQPPGVSNKQMYKTLGNSVNVKVISSLLSYLFSFEDNFQE